MKNNVFKHNFAVFGGGGIYFKNKILIKSPYEFNTFSNNQALFANDFYTFPVKVRFQDDKYFKSWKNKSRYSITVVPGITNFHLNFSVVDFYGQTIKSINGYFLSHLKIIWYYFLFWRLSTLQLKNPKFVDLNDNFTKITSTSYSLIQNGILNYHLNIFLFIQVNSFIPVFQSLDLFQKKLL